MWEAPLSDTLDAAHAVLRDKAFPCTVLLCFGGGRRPTIRHISLNEIDDVLWKYYWRVVGTYKLLPKLADFRIAIIAAFRDYMIEPPQRNHMSKNLFLSARTRKKVVVAPRVKLQDLKPRLIRGYAMSGPQNEKP